MNAATHLAKYLSVQTLSVQQDTLLHIADLASAKDTVLPKHIAQMALRDPMMSLIVLQHLARHPNKLRSSEITTIEHAIMMLGVEPFFNLFSQLSPLQNLPSFIADPKRILYFYQVMARSYVASRLAQHWSAILNDMQSEEIQVAALLYDMSEALLWMYMPIKSESILEHSLLNPLDRSVKVQQHVLGFTLLEVERELAEQWNLPELTKELIDQRTQNLLNHFNRAHIVQLAVQITRHYFKARNDPALPDDWHLISQLFNQDESVVKLETVHLLNDYCQDWQLKHTWSTSNVPGLSDYLSWAYSEPMEKY